jgi:hypothetical protein
MWPFETIHLSEYPTPVALPPAEPRFTGLDPAHPFVQQRASLGFQFYSATFIVS